MSRVTAAERRLLAELLLRRRFDLVACITTRMTRFRGGRVTSGRYRTLARQLVETLASALPVDPALFSSYVITRGRLADRELAGELLRLLEALREEAWLLASARLPLRDRGRLLGALDGYIGSARGLLVQALEERELGVTEDGDGELERRLALGTQPTPIVE